MIFYITQIMPIFTLPSFIPHWSELRSQWCICNFSKELFKKIKILARRLHPVAGYVHLMMVATVQCPYLSLALPMWGSQLPHSSECFSINFFHVFIILTPVMWQEPKVACITPGGRAFYVTKFRWEKGFQL